MSISHILDIACRSVSGDHTDLRSPWEALALVGHACMVADGFTLIGLSEDHLIPQEELAQTLPQEWNESTVLSFAYRKEESKRRVLKVTRLGERAMINALDVDNQDNVMSLNVAAQEYFSGASIPMPCASLTPERFANGFTSREKLQEFVDLFQERIIRGFVATTTPSAATREQTEAQIIQGQPQRQPTQPPQPPQAQPQPQPAPQFPPEHLTERPRNAYPDFPPPEFEDPYEIGRYPRSGGGDYRPPANIGERDLYPSGLGPHDPFRPYLGGRVGGGGMHPTFDDPMFQGPGSGRGRGEDSSFDVPPGARYDPVGPGDRRGRGGLSGFPGGGRGRGGFGGGPFGGGGII